MHGPPAPAGPVRHEADKAGALALSMTLRLGHLPPMLFRREGNVYT